MGALIEIADRIRSVLVLLCALTNKPGRRNGEGCLCRRRHSERPPRGTDALDPGRSSAWSAISR